MRDAVSGPHARSLLTEYVDALKANRPARETHILADRVGIALADWVNAG